MINLPTLIGHRGVKNLAPENTIQSIELAIQLGLKWIEIDVKVSKDSVPFLLHDDNLDRTTTGIGCAANYMYQDIKKLDAGKFFYNKPTKIYPPKLKEVLCLCSDNNIGINIELKSNLGFEKKNVEAVVNLLNTYKFQNPYYFSSFDWQSVYNIKKLLPNSFAGILIDQFNKNVNLYNIVHTCRKYDLFCCGFNEKIVTNEVLDLCKKNNIIVTVYSSKNISMKKAKKLWKIGVDSIFIDDPSEFMLR